MKNRDKYKNELTDVIKMDGNICEFMIKHGVSKMFGKDMESFCGETECTSCTTALQLWLDEEYEEPEVDWSKVEVDTPIWVRNDECDEWEARHFAKYEDEVVYSWVNGGTSWSKYNAKAWNFAKLAESDEVGVK